MSGRPYLALLLACATLSACSDQVSVAAPSGLTSEARSICADLIDALPDSVADLERRPVTASAAEVVAAYGDPAIVVVCGAPEPGGFDPQTSQCVNVDSVGWFISDEVLEGPAPDGSPAVLSTVNRAVSIELRLPIEAWPPAAAFADLSPSIGANVPGEEC